MVEQVIERLRAVHRQTDEQLQALYERFGLRAIESVDDALAPVRFIAQSTGAEDDHEDRWFGGVGRTISLFLETVGCRVTIDELDRITDRHFHSWIAPEDEDLTRYADEVAALSIERLFEERYGDTETA